jgi:calcineurin-like phosphoesterase family protein
MKSKSTPFPHEQNTRLAEAYHRFLSTPQFQAYLNDKKVPLRQSTLNSMEQVCSAHQQRDIVSQLVTERLAQGKRVLAWSDQHFNHKNIIRFQNRGFDDQVHLMNEHMLACYERAVQPDDLVIWGGDVSFGSITDIRPRLAALPGTKILVLGNHEFDREFRNHHVFDYTVLSFAFDLPSTEARTAQTVWCTHVPMSDLELPKGVINLHGHTHRTKIGPRHVNMSVECVDYTPTLLTSLLS